MKMELSMEDRLNKIEDKVDLVFTKVTNGLSDTTKANHQDIQDLKKELTEHKINSIKHRNDLNDKINSIDAKLDSWNEHFSLHTEVEEKVHEIQAKQFDTFGEKITTISDKLDGFDKLFNRVLLWGLAGLGTLILGGVTYTLANPDKVIEVLKVFS